MNSWILTVRGLEVDCNLKCSILFIWLHQVLEVVTIIQMLGILRVYGLLMVSSLFIIPTVRKYSGPMKPFVSQNSIKGRSNYLRVCSGNRFKE